MGTEVLRIQDHLLAERFHVWPASFPDGRNYFPTTRNNHFNHNIINNNNGYRTDPKHTKRLPSFDEFQVVSKHAKRNSNPNNEFCSMQKPNILRRGESLDSLDNATWPDTMYAGSAFSVSPPPSDLPLPTFSKKHSFDDYATRDLRRLLRLE